MGSAAGAKKAREARARQRAEQLLRQRRMDCPDIDTFVTDRRYLGNSIGEKISLPQRVLLRGCYGMRLTKAELGVWAEATQRAYPGIEFQEVTVVAGSRAGKDSRFLAVVVLYEAIYGAFTVNIGESAVIPVVAQDAKAAQIAWRLMRDYLKASPELARELVREKRDSLLLRNGVEIRVFPCTSKAIYGYSIPCGAMDEIGRFKFEGSADSDVDIQASILRGMVSYSKAKLFKVSTPSGKDGVLFGDFQESYGKEDPTRLVWQLSSEKMNPAGVDRTFLARMKARLDPVRYARLFNAEFTEDLGVFLPAALIDQATARGVTVRPPARGVKYIAALDANAGGEDAFTFSICHLEGERGQERVVQDYGQAWEKGRGPMNLENLVGQVCSVLEAYYDVRTIYGDRLTGQWIVEAFARHGVSYKHPYLKRRGDGKTDEVYVTRSLAYTEAAVLFRTEAISILDDPSTARELRNLEQSGSKVDHPVGGHDDRANALCLAATMAYEQRKRAGGGGFGPPSVHVRDYTRPVPSFRLMDQGTRFLGGDLFAAKSGEVFRDPRGL